MSEDELGVYFDETRLIATPRRVTVRLNIVLFTAFNLLLMSLFGWLISILLQRQRIIGDARLNMGILFGLFGMLVPALAAFIFLKLYRKERRLLEHGRVARATILTKTKQQERSGPAWMITYRFTAPDGESASGRRGSIPFEGPEIVLDHPLVFYDPQKPQVNELYPMRTVRLAGS